MYFIARSGLCNQRKIHRDNASNLRITAGGLMIRHHDNRLSVGRHLNRTKGDTVCDNIAAIFMLDDLALETAAHTVGLIRKCICAA